LTPNGRLEKRTRALPQKASYSITSSAVVTIETGHHGLQGKLERDFLEEEREEEKAIIRATGQEKGPE
jgi:hypothetical protein